MKAAYSPLMLHPPPLFSVLALTTWQWPRSLVIKANFVVLGLSEEHKDRAFTGISIEVKRIGLLLLVTLFRKVMIRFMTVFVIVSVDYGLHNRMKRRHGALENEHVLDGHQH